MLSATLEAFMPMMAPTISSFDWAVIGTGFIFPRHKQAIEDNGGRVVETYNTKNNWRDVLKSDVRNVAICTPNDLHYRMAKACLDAGKTVLVEKPPVINERELNDLLQYDNLYVVLQLRHHPAVEEFRRVVKSRDNLAKLFVSVYRDEDYFEGWKGDDKRSGGILFNLGSHYFDIIFYVMGFQQVEIEYDINITKDKTDQYRIVELNGYQYNFSSKDNLSYEGLHYNVYRALKEGGATRLLDCERTLRHLCSLRREL